MHRKHLEKFIKILIGATFFVPLIVLPSSYIFPFIVPKIIWFRSLSLLMLWCYILLLAVNWSEYRPKLSALNIAVGLFFISFSISTFVGVDWYRSFWDNHERMLGLFTIFHYIIYYFVITSVVREWRDWKWLLRTFLLAGGIVMLIGVLQKFVNPELLLNRGSGRVSATLGNSIYYSGYGLFLMFIGYLLAIKENPKLKNFWFWYAAVGGFFGFLGIFLGGTRGAMLGLIAGLGVLAISYLMTIRGHQKTRILIFSGLALLVLLGSILFVFRQSDFARNIPGVGRLVNASLFEGTGATRLMAWGIAIDAWQEKPIFGWGPNNYYYAFNKYYNPKFLEHGWGETWFDNAHSVVMNTLAVQGTFGILTYFGMLGAVIFMLWRGWKKSGLEAHVVAIGSAFIVANLVAKALVFDDPTSYLYFFFFLAFINTRITNNATRITNNADLRITDKDKMTKNISTGLAVTVGLVILLLLYSTNINPARANQASLQAIKVLGDNPQTAEEIYLAASNIPSPHIDDIRNDYSRYTAELAGQLLKNKKTAEAGKIVELAIGELQKNLDLHPLDIRVHIQLTQLYFLQAQIKQDVIFIIEAEKLIEQALQLSPRRQQIQYTLSSIKLQLNKPKEAIQLLQDSIDNNPRISEGWTRLMETYIRTGKKAEAKEKILEAENIGVIFSDEDRVFLNDLFGIANE